MEHNSDVSDRLNMYDSPRTPLTLYLRSSSTSGRPLLRYGPSQGGDTGQLRPRAEHHSLSALRLIHGGPSRTLRPAQSVQKGVEWEPFRRTALWADDNNTGLYSAQWALLLACRCNHMFYIQNFISDLTFPSSPTSSPPHHCQALSVQIQCPHWVSITVVSLGNF